MSKAKKQASPKAASKKVSGTKKPAADAGRSSRKGKIVPSKDFEGGKREEEKLEAKTISGTVLNEAHEDAIAEGSEGHDMETSPDESETDED